ncbi:hypothetical protein PIB30_094128, partial [Stylosanthes scabra]|nr:hypothetical protein [Stylosanthes scabra]
ELIRSVIIANPTGPVLVPNHYRTHFPEDDTLIAPNVYVLFSIYNMGVSSFLIWYAGTLALVTPMACTTPVVGYCRKPGRQPAGPHYHFGSRYVITVTFFLLTRGSKLYT